MTGAPSMVNSANLLQDNYGIFCNGIHNSFFHIHITYSPLEEKKIMDTFFLW